MTATLDATRFEFDHEAFDLLPPDRRRAALRSMEELAGGHRNNPLWRFDPLAPDGSDVPHLQQHSYMLSWRTPEGRLVKFRVFVGGNRAGKTTSGDVADIIDCCDREVIPPHLQAYKRWDAPINMYLVAVSTRAIEKIHLPIFRKWCPKNQLVGNSVDKAFNKEFSTLHFKNGSTISFMTQGMEVEVFQGTALHRVHFDEEPLYDHGYQIFGECMQRLADYNGDCLLTFTPLNGMTWVYDSLWLPWAEQQEEQSNATEGFAMVGEPPMPTFLVTVDQDDNPVIDAEGKAAALALAKDPTEIQARRHGRFVSFSGKVYDGFDRERHVVEDEEVLERMRVVAPDGTITRAPTLQMLLGGLDPGFRHMAGMLWVALDHDGVWIYPELTLAETIISSVAKEILMVEQELGLRPDLYVADPAIVKRDAQTGKTDQTAYADAGVLTRLGNNDVRPGINVIKNLLAADRIHIARGCTVLLDQFNRYRWKQTKRSEDKAPQRPVKRDDHLLDALRYAVMAMPIPEAMPVPDERSKLERLLAADIERAAQDRQVVYSPQGPGYFG